MKKIIAFALALCLLSGIMAFADNTITNESQSKELATTITYEMAAPKEEYIVTIPAALALDEDGKGQLVLSVDPSNFENPNKCIQLSLTASQNYNDTNKMFYLTANGGLNKISYTIENSWAQDPLTIGDVICQVVGGNDIIPALLNVEADVADAVPGSYTDTLTFTVSIEDWDSDNVS